MVQRNQTTQAGRNKGNGGNRQAGQPPRGSAPTDNKREQLTKLLASAGGYQAGRDVVKPKDQRRGAGPERGRSNGRAGQRASGGRNRKDKDVVLLAEVVEKPLALLEPFADILDQVPIVGELIALARDPTESGFFAQDSGKLAASGGAKSGASADGSGKKKSK